MFQWSILAEIREERRALQMQGNMQTKVAITNELTRERWNKLDEAEQKKWAEKAKESMRGRFTEQQKDKNWPKLPKHVSKFLMTCRETYGAEVVVLATQQSSKGEFSYLMHDRPPGVTGKRFLDGRDSFNSVKFFDYWKNDWGVSEQTSNPKPVPKLIIDEAGSLGGPPRVLPTQSQKGKKTKPAKHARAKKAKPTEVSEEEILIPAPSSESNNEQSSDEPTSIKGKGKQWAKKHAPKRLKEPHNNVANIESNEKDDSGSDTSKTSMDRNASPDPDTSHLDPMDKWEYDNVPHRKAEMKEQIKANFAARPSSARSEPLQNDDQMYSAGSLACIDQSTYSYIYYRDNGEKNNATRTIEI
ncbi:hypothetical protein K474DRAFT_1704983 [Panus rudis PR-1116 ss-1]|nr:hypothetical protein K474DRAFT_1704983 [Panus rudis PR-1116 ss-1]